MSKGSKRRPGDEEAYRRNFDAIFADSDEDRFVECPSGLHLHDPETDPVCWQCIDEADAWADAQRDA